ncbi:14377_t:CDS:1, partial [Cetraspora pellucida]
LANDGIEHFTPQTEASIEIVEDEISQTYEELYIRLINATENVLEILKDQQNKKNFRWIKNVKKNFKPMEQMVSEIHSYKRRKVMPRTLKDHTNNTLFFD